MLFLQNKSEEKPCSIYFYINPFLHGAIPHSQNEIKTRVFFSSIQTYYLYRGEASFQKHLDKDQLSWLHLALKILLFKNWLVWIQDPFIKWTWPFHRFKLPPTDMVFSYHIYTTTVCVCSLCAKINYLNMKQKKKKNFFSTLNQKTRDQSILFSYFPSYTWNNFLLYWNDLTFLGIISFLIIDFQNHPYFLLPKKKFFFFRNNSFSHTVLHILYIYYSI